MFCPLPIFRNFPSFDIRIPTTIIFAAFIGVQRVTGEIITLLNGFGTPPFVFERIFSSPYDYQFTEAEMAELTTITSFK